MPLPAPFEPFEIIPGEARRGIVIVADHARRDLPAGYGSLGLPSTEFDRHIAYDIGAEAVTRTLAARLGVPAVLALYSRLLIDPNRGADDPTLIRQLYDGTVIPGNHPLADAERRHRLQTFHAPYHAAIASTLRSVLAVTGREPFIVSIHSFTPTMQGRARPWQVGVLWAGDGRGARPVIDLLSSDPLLTVGDNEPYAGNLPGDTMDVHAVQSGFAHALIELRQDLVADPSGVRAWADRLAPIIEDVADRPDIRRSVEG